MKTKNAPKDLKCKINHTFFWKQGFPKGGGGGGPTLGKNSQKIPFFGGGGASLTTLDVGNALKIILKAGDVDSIKIYLILGET